MPGRKLRSVSAQDGDLIRHYIYKLRIIRSGLRSLGASKAAAYVQRALKSTEGALRHSERAIEQQARDREEGR